METKIGFLLLTVLVGVFAVPTPKYKFFEDPTTRIVGGTQSAVGSRPYMVAFTSGLLIRSYFCGGSLVSTRSILTAAHCIDHVYSRGSLTSTLRATVGTNRWNTGGTDYTLARNVSHPNWLGSTYKNDIGILITNNEVVLSGLIAPAPINYEYIPGGVPAVVSGWGRIRNNGAISSPLLEVDVLTVDGEQCVKDVAEGSISLNIRAPAVEPHIEICAFNNVNFGTCQGDSGSPLVLAADNRQIGVVSWGFPCARGVPDMFVRISAFADWLQENLV